MYNYTHEITLRILSPQIRQWVPTEPFRQLKCQLTHMEVTFSGAGHCNNGPEDFLTSKHKFQNEQR